MVKSLRYWLQVVGLTSEKMVGKKLQEFTDVGKIIYENDSYTEELGTLALIHYFLATNKENATSWYFFFNIFKNIEFNKDDFIIQLKNYIKANGEEVSDRALDDDYNCILNTYIPKIRLSAGKENPESNIDCPLGELNLLEVVNKKEKIYKKAMINFENLNPFIALAIILKEYPEKKEIKISSLLTEERSIGKVFNLDMETLIKILYSLERMARKLLLPRSTAPKSILCAPFLIDYSGAVAGVLGSSPTSALANCTALKGCRSSMASPTPMK